MSTKDRAAEKLREGGELSLNTVAQLQEPSAVP
jgi:hypothetical protein